MKNYLPHCPGFYFEIRKSIDLASDFTELVRHKYGAKPNLHNITLQHLPELLTRGKLPVKV